MQYVLQIVLYFSLKYFDCKVYVFGVELKHQCSFYFFYHYIKKTKFIKITNISLLFRSFVNVTLTKLLKRREIFVILINFVGFFIHIYLNLYICIIYNVESRTILEPLYQFGIPNSDPEILKNVRLVLYLFSVQQTNNK